LPAPPAVVEHVFHQYVIRTPHRDALSEFLRSRSIVTGIHYPVPVHLQPAYRDRHLTFGNLRETESICNEILSLPMFPQLSDADVDRVASAIAEWARARTPAPKGAAP
jgi:dTDP-4-amino-4,6-dideoxygalactose transaminase